MITISFSSATLMMMAAVVICARPTMPETDVDDDISSSPMAHIAWHRFLAQYGRSYASDAEHDARYEIFRSNHGFIRQHNTRARLGLESYWVALNDFADLSGAEYAARLSFRNRPHTHLTIDSDGAVDGALLPASVDWRDQGLVTPVKNQGKCGSCWSFAATGSMEGAYGLANGTLLEFSEQALVDCVHDGNYTCTTGGDYTDAFAFVIANGTVTEHQYGYVSGIDPRPETCQLKKLDPIMDFAQYVPTKPGCEYALQKAVAQRPGVAVAIDASHIGFQFYFRGIYKPRHCSRTELDHAVLVVGYDSRSKGDDYWIVKNSWGTDWGQQGYVWIARNHDNMCGIATQPAYIVTKSQVTPNSTEAMSGDRSGFTIDSSHLVSIV